MGILQLYKFISTYCPNAISNHNIEFLQNKTIIIDANYLLYRLVSSVRYHNNEIYNDNIVVTHIHLLLLKLVAFKKYNIKPIFVFDGKPPDIKLNTLKLRNKNTVQITEKELKQCKNLILHFGFGIIDSLEEADSQCAKLNRYIIISDDLDILLFGGKIIVKNFSTNSKKLFQVIYILEILKTLNISYSTFVDIGILLGNDYIHRTFGPKKLYDMFCNMSGPRYMSIEDLINNNILPHNKNFDIVRQYYLYPKTHKNIKIKYKKHVNIVSFLKEYGYSLDKIKKYVSKQPK